MKKHNNYSFNSLIEPALFKDNGDSSFSKGKHGFIKETFFISSDEQSKKFNKPRGKYSLLTLKNILDCTNEVYLYYLKQLTETLKSYLPEINNNDTILVVGLGNRHIASDSLGIEVIKNINITRNFVKKSPQVCAFAPSVLGLTGIETADTIDGLASKIKPDIIIMVDSLCAGDSSRLGVSFQINNNPIIPGSGINNSRKKLSNNIKTISIGVPLVIYASTFIKSALIGANIDKNNISDKELKNKLNNLLNQDFNELVTLSEIDYSVKRIGKIIAEAINSSLV